MKRLIAALALLTLSGCAASYLMREDIGRPMEQIIARDGQPANYFDTSDGRRAFQWVRDRTVGLPPSAISRGHASVSGDSVYWRENTTIVGGGPIQQRCVYTYYGRWHPGLNAWMVDGIEPPRPECE